MPITSISPEVITKFQELVGIYPICIEETSILAISLGGIHSMQHAGMG